MAYGPGNADWEADVKRFSKMNKEALRTQYITELKFNNRSMIYGLESMSKDELITAILSERRDQRREFTSAKS